MKEYNTFQIDNYVLSKKPWTNDWSKNQKSQYFSNKAPGASFIAYPLFYILDSIENYGINTSVDRNDNRYTYIFLNDFLISLITQTIPYLFISIYILGYLTKQYSLSTTGGYFFLLSFLLGNTASLFMKTFWGHGLCSIILLLSINNFRNKNFTFFGFFFFLSILVDYFNLNLIIPLTLFLIITKQNKLIYYQILKGAVVPLAAWIFYHTKCFGGPFELATKYQNPIYLSSSLNKINVFNQFNLSPSLQIIYEQIFGTSRGLLYTQPWILLSFFIIIYYFKSKKILIDELIDFLILIALPCMILVLSTFYGWHGGGTPGPRYLSSILPLVSISIATKWLHLKSKTKIALVLLLCPTILLNCLIHLTTYLAPVSNIWHFYYTQFLVYFT